MSKRQPDSGAQLDFTRAEVEAAKLQIELLTRLGHPVDDRLRRVADQEPAPAPSPDDQQPAESPGVEILDLSTVGVIQGPVAQVRYRFADLIQSGPVDWQTVYTDRHAIEVVTVAHVEHVDGATVQRRTDSEVSEVVVGKFRLLYVNGRSLHIGVEESGEGVILLTGDLPPS